MKTKRILSVMLAFAVCLSTLLPGISAVAGPVDNASADGAEFEEIFANPLENAKGYQKPFVRWWIGPDRMNEEEIRREIKNFKDGGFGGVEICWSNSWTTVPFNTPAFDEAASWILQAGIDFDMQIDPMLGVGWPLGTPSLADPYAEGAPSEQALFIRSVPFDASPGSMAYMASTWQLPTSGLNLNQFYKPVAVTAAKVITAGSNAIYDPETAMDISSSFNADTGAGTWTAPSEGNWTIFYMYQQATGARKNANAGYTVDHLSREGAQLVIDTFDTAFGRSPGLKELYQQAGGSFFSDSLELSSVTNWTGKMLEEFMDRRGYDLTPYLPAIYRSNGMNAADVAMEYDFKDIGLKVRLDYAQTISELFDVEHIGYLRDWMNDELGIQMRYQAHRTLGTFFHDVTQGYMASDVVETESWASGSGDSIDYYRIASGVAHMKNSIFTAEFGEWSNLLWRQTYTGSLRDDQTQQNYGATNDFGMMHYANRTFAAGVNTHIFHGSVYKYDIDRNGNTPTWPGVTGMGSYPHEWDDKTPMWEHVNVMTDYFTRAQTAMQQGKADMDLAYYRVYEMTNTLIRSSFNSVMQEVDKAGYTYDYVTAAMLAQENAGKKDGLTVIEPDGPSYKALVIDQRRAGNLTSPTTVEPFPMRLDIAEKILNYAKAGLPVVVVGDPPGKAGSYSGTVALAAADDVKLAAIMNELLALPNVTQVTDTQAVRGRAGVAAALAAMGVQPDAKPADPASNTNLAFHRNAKSADIYFLANDVGNAPCNQSVTFKGEGTPYLLDVWSGEIVPIPEYSKGDGVVTLDVSLAPQQQMFIAIAEDGYFSKSVSAYSVDTNADEIVYGGNVTLGARTSAAGDYFVKMSDGRKVEFKAEAAEAPIDLTDGVNEWKFVLHEWKEDTDKPKSYYATKVVDTNQYTITTLVPWYQFGSGELGNAVGNGEYATAFNLEKGWTQGQGAILQFERVSDIMRVWINGNEVYPDQVSKSVDIGEYLVAGENEIVVKVVSNMANFFYMNTTASSNFPNRYQFGVMGGVTVTPYIQTEISSSVFAGIRADEPAIAVNNPASYIVSLSNVKGAGVVTLSFTADSRYLDLNSAAALNGFSILNPLAWEYVGGQLWKGTVKLYCPGFVNADGPLDVLRVSGTARDLLGDTAVTLTDVSVTGNADGFSGALQCVIVSAEAATSIVPSYSKYDLNHDGRIDELDLAIVVFYYLANDLESDWDLVKFDIASAKDCDVARNGRVDLADMIEVIANYADSY
ncbi:MAG: hypothetical protein FWH55_10215 [Oscillospiraceae bacterium]|nr:hypothetical protein [Oscillospiraceae bacterium]